MPRRLRHFEPRIFFLTNRTLQGRLLLLPTPRTTQIIGGILARAVHRFGIKLYAFTFLANHFHMLAADPDGHPGRISEFMQYVQSNIARKIGPRVGWSGKFWHRRFSGEPVLDDDALAGRLRYLVANGVKEGLVEQADQWPGLTSIPELAHGVRRLFPWIDGTSRAQARLRGKDDSDHLFTTNYRLDLAVFPMWQELPDPERQRLVRQLIHDAETEARNDRRDKPVLGLERILAQDPLDKPVRSKHSPQPICHAATLAAYKAYKAAMKVLACAYAEASALFRAGDARADFPPFTFRPPLPITWRAVRAPPAPDVIPA